MIIINSINQQIDIKMRTQTAALVTIVTLAAISHLNYQFVQQPLPQPMFEIDQQTDLTVSSMDINFQTLFSKWKKIHSKTYQSIQENNYRLSVFIDNCQEVYNHNLYMDDFGYTFWYGLNSFSDLTEQQYISLLTTYPSRKHYQMKTEQSDLLNLTLQCTGTIIISPNPPDEMDWTKKAVTPVLNQGGCGSSYAISSIGAVEGLYSLRVGKLDTFSIQQIIDCSQNYGNEGCYGGFMDQAFWYIIDNGLATSKSYATRNDTVKQSCKYTKTMKATSFTKCADIPTGNYTKLLSAVVQQPTSVALDASGLKKYAGGIFNGECSDSYINQAMLIVGYGTEDNQTYWKIKNSMGTSWGENGYLLLEREQKDGPGKCGVQLVAVVPQSIV